jgi:hypothetical protein
MWNRSVCKCGTIAEVVRVSPLMFTFAKGR